MRTRCVIRTLNPSSVLTRSYAASHGPASSAELLKLLGRNKELSPQDAKNELRWIRQALDSEPHLISSGQSAEETLVDFVKRRSAGEPLQYILGTTDFGPLTLLTRPPTLIPRPETAHITDLLASEIISRTSGAKIHRPLRILDLCSGSGCIALLLKHRLGERAHLLGRDISARAIRLSRDNAQALGLDVDFAELDIWGDLAGVGQVDIDMVVSNPPYIPRKEWEGLDRGVREYEDPGALVGDPEDLPNGAPSNYSPNSPRGGSSRSGRGLAFYRRIAEVLPVVCTPREELMAAGWGDVPRLAVEVGYGQAEEVEDILVKGSGGFVRRTDRWEDQYGVKRMVVGW